MFTQELAAEILQRLSQGESLRSICRTQGFPTETAVRKWVIEREDFGSQYARARDFGLDCRAERLLEIAADVEPEMVNSRRLQFDAERWYLSKLAPKTYGDRINQQLTGADGETLKIVVTGVEPTKDNT